MAKKGRSKITKGEKLLYFCGIMSVGITLILKVFCGASVGNLNMRIEKLKYEITTQEKKNESLNMKISELASFDTVKDIVKEMGLAYNDENIKVVTED